MIYLYALIMIGIGYLCGSVPVGYLMARLRGVNLLESGSGKTGSTNVLRSAGKFAATVTLLGDAFKGIIPTAIAVGLVKYGFFPAMYWIPALTGAAAIAGHNYSLFLKFRGGVGAITMFAALAALSIWAAIIAIVIAFIALMITRFASMGSLTGAITGLVTLVIFGAMGITPWAYILYGLIVLALVVIALRPNFKRIREGTERTIGVPEKNIKTIS